MTKDRKTIGWYAALCTALVNVVLILALLNALLFVFYRGREEKKERTIDTIIRRYGTNALHAAYPDLDHRQIEDLLEETWDRQLFEYEPFVQFRERAFAGRYVNVDPQGYRRTENQGAWPPEPSKANVFLFGGSIVFGYGVRDEETLASHLQGALSRALGMDVRVYNFGRGFYYSTLERLLLEKLLMEGHRPHLALFVDGPNDFSEGVGDPFLTAQLRQLVATASPQAPAGRFLAEWFNRQPLARWIREWKAAKEEGESTPLDERRRSWDLAGARPSKEKHRDIKDRSGFAIRQYLNNKKMIEAVCAVYDVPVLFVWAPTPYYKYDLLYHPFARKSRDSKRARHTADGYARMAEWVRTRSMGTNFLWCADIQEGVQEQLYVDNAHYAPRLNRTLAQIVASGIVERVPSARLPDGEEE
ncbi:MAG: hypothetical protein KKC51_13535 [Verrucomicrobia bacterium]|nr:hypothetical protein [Verrucomicrobiota bacterium]